MIVVSGRAGCSDGTVLCPLRSLRARLITDLDSSPSTHEITKLKSLFKVLANIQNTFHNIGCRS